jgi:hypothetical protein
MQQDLFENLSFVEQGDTAERVSRINRENHLVN